MRSHVVTAAILFSDITASALAQTAPPAPAVIVAPVTSRQITETRNYVGRVEAINKVDLVARVPGFIEERLFTEGQLVRKGDLLFRIEQATYQAAVEQGEANVAKAKAVEVNAAAQLGRGKALLPKDFIPKASVDQLTAAQQSAAADILVAQAALNEAQINLGYTAIQSPIDGRIGLVKYTVGNLVGPNSGSLATIVSFDPIYVLFQASERDVLDFKHRLLDGGPQNGRVSVQVRLPDGTLYDQPGLANFLDIQVASATDTITVRAELPNPKALLVPGGIVGVVIQTGAPWNALMVPQSAIQLDQAGSYVLVVDDANKVELRRIERGDDRGTESVVTAGLKAGERVIVEGVLKVRPGQIVQASLAPGN